jgi:hypothetical protein
MGIAFYAEWSAIVNRTPGIMCLLETIRQGLLRSKSIRI